MYVYTTGFVNVCIYNGICKCMCIQRGVVYCSVTLVFDKQV